MPDTAPDLRERVARVQDQMEREGIGGLVIYGSGQHNMLRMDQVMYLTGHRPIGPSVLLVPREGDLTLLVSPPWDAARARESAAGHVTVRGVQGGELVRETASASRGLTGPLALSGRDVMPIGEADQLFAVLGPDVRNADTLVPSLGRTRDAAELACVERAAAIADEGFRRLCEVAEPGMWEHELAAEIEAAMQRAGSEDNFGLVGGGSHNIAVRPAMHRQLERGDVIVGEITPCYRGYFAQLCRSVVLGSPTDVQREKYDMLIQAQRSGFEAALPGHPSSDIARAVNAVISAAGYGEYCRQPYMRTRGHGLGFGGVVPYDVTEDNSPILEEGMTLVIHPNQYLPETGYMMLGDTVVIEASGPRRLTQTPIQLFWREG